MFIESDIQKISGKGWIEVVTGSMFSGKTEELIRRIRRAEIAKQKVLIFKPKIDKRYSEKNVVSHNDNLISSLPIANAKEMLKYAQEFDVIGIDEAQFFDDSLVDICNYLANIGKRVIVAALDMDFNGKPFGAVPKLMAIAEYVTKVHAICIKCGNLANHSHRLSNQQKLVVLGEKDVYEPLCRNCFQKARENYKDKGRLFP